MPSKDHKNLEKNNLNGNLKSGGNNKENAKGGGIFGHFFLFKKGKTVVKEVKERVERGLEEVQEELAIPETNSPAIFKKDELGELVNELEKKSLFNNLKDLIPEIKKKLDEFNCAEAEKSKKSAHSHIFHNPYENAVNLNVPQRYFVKKCFDINKDIQTIKTIADTELRKKKIDELVTKINATQDIRQFMVYYQIFYDNKKILDMHRNPNWDKILCIDNSNTWQKALESLKKRGNELINKAAVNTAMDYADRKAILKFASEHVVTTAHRNNHWWQFAGSFFETVSTRRVKYIISEVDKDLLRNHNEIIAANKQIPVFGNGKR